MQPGGNLASSPPPLPPGLPHGVVLRTQPAGISLTNRHAGRAAVTGLQLPATSRPAAEADGSCVSIPTKAPKTALDSTPCRTTGPSNPRASNKGKACRELWFRAPRGAKGVPVKGRPSGSHGMPPHAEKGGAAEISRDFPPVHPGVVLREKPRSPQARLTFGTQEDVAMAMGAEAAAAAAATLPPPRRLGPA